MCAVYCIGSHQQQHKILEKYQVIPCSRKFTVTVLMSFERQSRITNVSKKVNQRIKRVQHYSGPCSLIIAFSLLNHNYLSTVQNR